MRINHHDRRIVLPLRLPLQLVRHHVLDQSRLRQPDPVAPVVQHHQRPPVLPQIGQIPQVRGQGTRSRALHRRHIVGAQRQMPERSRLPGRKHAARSRTPVHPVQLLRPRLKRMIPGPLRRQLPRILPHPTLLPLVPRRIVERPQTMHQLVQILPRHVLVRHITVNPEHTEAPNKSKAPSACFPPAPRPGTDASETPSKTSSRSPNPRRP